MQEPTYMIIGAGGLLGLAVYERLSESSPDYRVFPFEHAHVDISNASHVKEIMEYIKPSVVINCASISSPDICECAEAGAFETNSVGPKILAQSCQSVGAKLVHFSTADIFSGTRYTPYTERCKPNPVNAYGRSKLAGEKAIQEHLKDHLIIRPGWIFHAESPNFLMDWTYKMDRRLTISVPPDIHGSPVFLLDLIDATKELIDRNARGVFHIANSDVATWESLLEAVSQLAGKRTNVKTFSQRQLTHFPVIPKYTALSTKKFSTLTKIKMRPWNNALKQCLFYMERYRP